MSLYLTAVLPPQDLAAEIDEIRKEISEKHQVFAALKPPVHITLYRPVDLHPDREDHLIQLLRPVCFRHKPFVQQLQNFDSFNNKTLFIQAEKSSELSALRADISGIFSKNKIDRKEGKEQERFHPHITIAYRDVQRDVFRNLWEEFRNRKFKRNYLTDHFTLLKHDGKRWNTLQDFPLRQSEALSLF